ncbi:MAG: hypothetical protein QOJ59_3526 [Thermomicrobiales bacterium]|jgi:hypothetical protein|nr:hypothetical protein [Thermomicrobiales bacterium]
MNLIASYAPEPRDLEPFVAEARRLIAEGAELDEVCGCLRANNIWQSDSITIAVELTGVARRDAKRMVSHSKTWSDLLPVTEQLHD